MTTATGPRPHLVIRGHRSPVRWVAAGGPNLVLSHGGDGHVRCWDAATGEEVGTPVRYDSATTAFLGLYGPALICADGSWVQRFDRITGDRLGDRLRPPLLFTATGGLGPVTIAAGMIIAGDMHGEISRWDAATGEPIGAPWQAHSAEVLSLTALQLPDGRTLLVTGGNDDAVRRWDATTGEPIGELTGHDDPVTALCHACVGGRDIVFGQVYRGPIHRWDALTGEPTGPALPQEGARYQPGCLVTDGQTLLSVDSDGTPWLWDLAREEPVQLPANRVNAVALVPTRDGPLVVTGAEHGRLRRWDLAGNPAGADLIGHGAKVNYLAAASTALVSAARDGVRCWDPATGAPVGKKLPMALHGLAAARTPDGRLRLAAGSDDGFLIGDPLAGTVTEISGEQVWDVATGLLPDGRAFFAGACADGRVRLIDAVTGKSTGLPGGRAGLAGLPGDACAVAVDATTVAAGGYHGMILRWDAITGERLGEPITASELLIMELRFHRLVDGRLLLISRDDVGVVRRWDALTGAELGEPLRAGGEAGAPFDPAAANPEHVLAVAHGDIVRCWDVRTGDHLGDIAKAVSVVNTGATLAIGRCDGTIDIWTAPPGPAWRPDGRDASRRAG